MVRSQAVSVNFYAYLEMGSIDNGSHGNGIVDPKFDDKPFEGAEKLLEITFQKPGCSITPNGNEKHHTKNGVNLSETDSGMERNLLRLHRDDVEKILDKVNCTILNECHSEQVTAYLLSESSLFIFEDRMIIKTCGQTNLLNAFEDFIGLGKRVGLDSVAEVFYSRPRFLNPDDQPFMHQKFKRETQTLLSYFDEGLAYVFGSTNSDCYHLFCFSRINSCRSKCTVEVIMNSLDDERRMLFFKDGDRTAADITKAVGFAGFFGPSADVVIDDYLFEPCGYSVNGIIDQKHYFTVHVTPEQCASYASFETDHCDNVAALVGKVVAIFQPSRFIVTVISDESSHGEVHAELASSSGTVSGYERCEFQYSVFCNQSATFARFQEDGGGAAAASGVPRPSDPKVVWCQDDGPYF